MNVKKSYCKRYSSTCISSEQSSKTRQIVLQNGSEILDGKLCQENFLKPDGKTDDLCRKCLCEKDLNQIKLIIFDCDGVLIDSEHLAAIADIEALSELGILLSTEEYLELALGKKEQHVEKILYDCTRKLIPPGFWSKAKKKRDEIFKQRLKPLEGVVELIEDLAIPYCIASSSDLSRLNFTLSITGLIRYFENRIFHASCVERGKPAPDIFLHASEKMEVSKHQCLVIEDSLAGIKAAKSAEMRVWGFSGGSHITKNFENKLKNEGLEHIFKKMHAIKAYLNQKYPETLFAKPQA